MNAAIPALPALPLVTVIVPTIGRPAYVLDTLRSVLAQDWPQLDVLVSDNAASVSTAELLARAGIDDPRLRFVTRGRRLGFSEHMNACIAQARGEYLMILSDDDQLAPGYVSEMSRFLLADPAVKVGLGRHIKIGVEATGLLPVPAPTLAAQVIDGAEFLSGLFSGRLVTGVLTHISMFARREDVLALGGFKCYPDGSHADNFLLLGLALRGKVALGAEQMMYRVYAGSFGLGTPFPALLAATRAFTADFATTVQATPSLDARDQALLVRLLKRNNTRLLLSRLRHVYRQRLSAPALIYALAQAARFAVTPVRWL